MTQSNEQFLTDLINQEFEHIERIKAGLPQSASEQLMVYSKEAYDHMFKEIEVIDQDKNTGLLMSSAERYLHELRHDTWKDLFDTIWKEINRRGIEVKQQLITKGLGQN